MPDAAAAGRARIGANLRRAFPSRRRTARSRDRAKRERRAPQSRSAPSLSQDMQRITVPADDVLRLRHLLFKLRIVGCEPVAAVRAFDQKQPLALPCVEAVNDFFRQDNPQRIPDPADLQLQHGSPPKCYYDS